MPGHATIPPGGRAIQTVGCSTLILLATAAYLAAGLFTYVAWQITGNQAWIDFFFRWPGALISVGLSAVELLFALRVCRQFAPGEPLLAAWRLIALSAGCDLVSSVAVQLLSPHWPWLRDYGLAVGGPLRFALLAAGLYFALQVYRQSGFLARLAAVDWIVLMVVAVYIVREGRDLGVAFHHGKHLKWAEAINWPVDPLLCLLLAEAMLLYRSARRMGWGWVTRCWVAFSAGIVLVILGDISIWAFNYGFLPYPWSNITWYLWLPAGAAFALAPVYQMEVIQRAGAG